jgi:hypothetical protein
MKVHRECLAEVRTWANPVTQQVSVVRLQMEMGSAPSAPKSVASNEMAEAVGLLKRAADAIATEDASLAVNWERGDECFPGSSTLLADIGAFLARVGTR